MLTIATFYSCNYIRLMKVIVAIFIVISGHAFAQSYESLTVNLRDAAGPDLGAYQANVRGYEWTVKNGSAAVNLTGNAPFMYWYQEPLSASVVTARITVVSATAGIFRAVFLPSDLNPSFMSNLTSGATNLRYGVGVDYSDGPESVKHGRFRLLSDPFSAGSVGTTFFSTNVNWALINWTGLPSYLLDAPTDGGIYARKDAAWYSIAGYATGGQWAADISAALVGVATGTPVYEVSGIGTDATARAWAQAGSNKAATAYGWGNHASAGYATGAPVYVESDPVWVADKPRYATGTPLYVESYTGSVGSLVGYATTARVEQIASVGSTQHYTKAQSDALYSTGTPVYVESDPVWVADKPKYATGTPLYVESYTGSVGSLVGYATTTRVEQIAAVGSTQHYTKAQSDALYATGTPLYVESFTGSVGSLSGYMPASAVTDAITSLSFPLASGVNVSQRVAAVEGAYISGAAVSNSFLSLTGGVVSGETTIQSGALNISGLDTGEGQFRVDSGGTYPRFFIFSKSSVLNPLQNTSIIGFQYIGNRIGYISVSTNGAAGSQPAIVRGVGSGATPGRWATLWDDELLPDPRNLSAGTNAPADWVNPSLAAVSNGLLSIGPVATNAQQTASNAASTASAATNLALAIGAGATNGLNAIGLVATNGQQVASNALAVALGVGVVVSNQVPSAWSQIATNHANMSNYAITNVDYIAFGTNTIDGSETNAIGIYNGHPSWVKAPGSVRTLASSDNLSSLGIQTTSGFNSSITNYARITPTGYSFPSAWNDSVGNNGDLVRSGTNMAFKSAGVWVRWTVVTNW